MRHAKGSGTPRANHSARLPTRSRLHSSPGDGSDGRPPQVFASPKSRSIRETWAAPFRPLTASVQGLAVVNTASRCNSPRNSSRSRMGDSARRASISLAFSSLMRLNATWWAEPFWSSFARASRGLTWPSSSSPGGIWPYARATASGRRNSNASNAGARPREPSAVPCRQPLRSLPPRLADTDPPP